MADTSMRTSSMPHSRDRDVPAKAISKFGDLVARKLRRIGRDDDAQPQPEEQLREPIAGLLTEIGRYLGLDVLTFGEVHLKALGTRPDFGVDVGGQLVGFIEVKAPGRGVPPECSLSARERRQWEKLKTLPNVMYTDGTKWAHYTYGACDCRTTLSGDLNHVGADLRVEDGDFVEMVKRFLRWPSAQPPSLRVLIKTLAGLCRLMRDEVTNILEREDRGISARPFTHIARDWQRLLFPKLKSADFPDAYAQTVVFALLLACASNVGFEGRSLPDIAHLLSKHHPLMGRALLVLTNPVSQVGLPVVDTIAKILSPVKWDELDGATSAYWVIYEDFLQEYDPTLKRKSGAYYTPDAVARFMVDFTDEVIKNELRIVRGLASDEVIVVDPAMGTGTFLVEVIRSVSRTITQEQSHDALTPYLRELYERRLVGFERQAAPYAVTELRLHQTLQAYGVEVPDKGVRYLTDTFDDPNARLLDYPELYEIFRQSREGANEVKMKTPVMAVIANPPYLDRAHKRDPARWIEDRREPGKPPDMTRPSIDDFRISGHGTHDHNLANLYVYFWRWATWKVFDAHRDHPKGVVAFITPAAYLTSAAFAGMRRYLRRTADTGWIIDVSPEGYRPTTNTRIFPGVKHRLCIAIFARRENPDPTTPARIRYRSIDGSRATKLEALTIQDLGPEAPGWTDCRDGWTDAFVPVSDLWLSCPALDDLMPWQTTGVNPNRAWVHAPDPTTLKRRWSQLIAAPVSEKNKLLKSNRDRTIDSRPSGDVAVPGQSVRLRDEHDTVPRIEEIAFHSFDRQYIILDRRVVDFVRSELWNVAGRNQVFVTEQHDQQITEGPGLTFSALVPYVHHFGGRGGQVLPLYRDEEKRIPNLADHLLHYLSDVLATNVMAEDFLAYVAGVVAHPGYTERFRKDLRIPGIRLPITTDPDLWARSVEAGREILWLHTYGSRYARPGTHQAGPPRLPVQRRPTPIAKIGGSYDEMPDSISYDVDTQTLFIGNGAISPVPAGVWEYRVGDQQVLRTWFEYRRRRARHAGPSSAPDTERSPLDEVRTAEWTPLFQDDLINLLNILTHCVDLEPVQAEILRSICNSPLVNTANLEQAGVLPVPAALKNGPRVERAQMSLLDQALPADFDEQYQTG